MPYLIAVAVLATGAIAFMLLRTPVADNSSVDTTETQSVTTSNEAQSNSAESDTVSTEANTEIDTPSTNEESEPSAVGATGSFTGEASYSTGRAVHELDVTLTLENDVVTAADITYDGLGEPQTPALRNFNEAYEVEVIGKDVDNINLSRVGGASWTSDAFNEAVAEIRAQI